MTQLDNVTILAADSINSQTALMALEFSCKSLKFKDAILFTDKYIKHDWIKIIPIDEMKSIRDYNKFMIRILPFMIDSDYILVIQADGFVINPNLWKPEFLKYDYIGAPWDLNGCRVWNKKCRIGNGGFSLRSRKLLTELQLLGNYDCNIPEDSFISDLVYDKGLKYPSTELAVSFSLECPLEDYPFDLSKSFGFHGKKIYNNLDRLCPYLFENEN